MVIDNIKDLIKTMFHKDDENSNVNAKLNHIYKQEYQKDRDFKVKAPANIKWIKTINMSLQTKRGETYLDNFQVQQFRGDGLEWYYFSPWDLGAIDLNETYDVAILEGGAHINYVSIGMLVQGLLSIRIPANTTIPNGQLYVRSNSMVTYRPLFATAPFSKVSEFPIEDSHVAYTTTFIDDNYTPQTATTEVIGDFSVIPLYPVIISASEGAPSAGIRTVNGAPFILTNPLFKYILS